LIARSERSRRAPTQKHRMCSAFVRVSDGTRTRDRLDHNPVAGMAIGSHPA
jgi:hypothetical protein